MAYVTERVRAFPELSIERVLREIRAMGYAGGRSALGEIVRDVRPSRQRGFEVRFQMAAGEQAQVDFAHFSTEFDDAPQQRRSIWLFTIVLGHSRYLWGRFVEHQDLQTVLRCHMEAFEHLCGVPREILYDRMKTAVLGEVEKHIIYNAKLVAFAQHYAFAPRACKAYRTAASANGVRSSVTVLSPHCSTGCCTMPSSYRLKGPHIASVSTQTCSPSICALDSHR